MVCLIPRNSAVFPDATSEPMVVARMVFVLALDFSTAFAMIITNFIRCFTNVRFCSWYSRRSSNCLSVNSFHSYVSNLFNLFNFNGTPFTYFNCVNFFSSSCPSFIRLNISDLHRISYRSYVSTWPFTICLFTLFTGT